MSQLPFRPVGVQNFIGRFLACLFASFCIQVAAQQENAANDGPVAAVPQWDPSLLANEEPSGWLSLELAVLIDDTSETLGSEYWPPLPTVRYPVSYRFLADALELEQLKSAYPFAAVTQKSSGEIEIAIPDPHVFIAGDKVALLAEAQGLVAQSIVNETQDTRGPEQTSDLDSRGASAIPFESLGTQDPEPYPAIDSLGDYQSPFITLDELVKTNVSQPSPIQPPTIFNTPASTHKSDSDSHIPTTPDSFEPPPLPSAYTKRPLNLLWNGVRELADATDNKVALSAAWLQPPGTKNLPIVLDDSGDNPSWPPVQGFIELRRGDTLRLGINVWLNTQGEYLPDNFFMRAPPKAPPRIMYVDATTGSALSMNTVVLRQTQLAHYERERPLLMRALIEFLRAQVVTDSRTGGPDSSNSSDSYLAPDAASRLTSSGATKKVTAGIITRSSLDTTTGSRIGTGTGTGTGTTTGTTTGIAASSATGSGVGATIDTLGSGETHGSAQTTLESILATYPRTMDTQLAIETDEHGRDNADNPEPDITGANTTADWPWRHLIHVADTRVIPDGKVRYFDHPVIKVVAAYRDLTWAEVYALGVAEFQDQAQASKKAGDDMLTAPPTMVVPPSLDGIR